MVNFASLSKKRRKRKPIDPFELFKSLPKFDGINDLYDVQSHALSGWIEQKKSGDVVIKMPTGSGKTLVGLLIAQASSNELHRGSLFLVENNQLVQQVVAQARRVGINAVPYHRDNLGADFLNGDQVVVGSYWVLFNGRSKFGVRGDGKHIPVGTIILDDAHASLPVVREASSVSIPCGDSAYKELAELFVHSFDIVQRRQQFDDIRGGEAGITATILEIPVSEWQSIVRDVTAILNSAVKRANDTSDSQSLLFGWPLLRERLSHCRALISRNAFTITPYLPPTKLFTGFIRSERRVYMSATFADDTGIVKTFGVPRKAVLNPVVPVSLAGVGKRMILPVPNNVGRREIEMLVNRVVGEKLGVVIEVPGNSALKKWDGVRPRIASGDNATGVIAELVGGDRSKPIVLVNRYDGVDLPDDACRLVVMDGLPNGRSDFERLDDMQLFGGAVLTKLIAQRIEQGMGRGTRGASDYCAVLLLGSDLAEWIRTETNAAYFTDATRAQIEVGSEIMEEIEPRELVSTILQGAHGDADFLSYCAERTAEIVAEQEGTAVDEKALTGAWNAREAWDFWLEGENAKAASLIDKTVDDIANDDRPYAGLLMQMASAIHYDSHEYALSERCQKRAHGLNDNLYKAISLAPHGEISDQARCVVQRVLSAKSKSTSLGQIERELSALTGNSDSHDFEGALERLGYWLGFESKRYDNCGDGPDVFWLMEKHLGLALEAKNGRKRDNPLSKTNHGQLLVSQRWGEDEYPGVEVIPVSVHHSRFANHNAHATRTNILPIESLGTMKKDTLRLLTELIESAQLPSDLEYRCQSLVDELHLMPRQILCEQIETFIEG